MKTILVIGVITTLIGVYQCGNYMLDYSILSNYGRGYVWGSVLLIVIGAVCIALGLRKNKSRNKITW